MLHRLYIGSDNTTKTLAMDTILAVAGRFFQGFSVNRIIGYYNGGQEDTALLEIETDDTAKVRELAINLRNTLNQDSVGMVVLPAEMSFI